jgi:predicted Fe-S protein YdhL (DUF1289 family)
MNDKSIQSPCVRNCCLGDDDVCLGCFRSIDEITGWSEADDIERSRILSNAAARRTAHQRNWPAKLQQHK